MATLNDVMDYSKYYGGTDEPPVFRREFFDLNGKIFVPVDDFKLGQALCENTKESVVLHHFVCDKKQNRLLINNLADRYLHEKVYAVTSPDFSVDSNSCWSCLNEGIILKGRICASRWQLELEEPVILTLAWGADKGTYKWAFGNVEKGSIVAVSSQGVEDIRAFENGIRVGIDMIQPEYICWLGTVFDFMGKYYDAHRIIRMQTRRKLLKMYKTKIQNKSAPTLFQVNQMNTGNSRW